MKHQDNYSQDKPCPVRDMTTKDSMKSSDFTNGAFCVDPDIRKATTPPRSFYHSAGFFNLIREAVFARSWHWLGDTSDLLYPGDARPVNILDQFLDEPVIITRGEQGMIRCLSNVCTHRGSLILLNPGRHQKFICKYHGRQFSTDGKFLYMPEFKNTEGFPRPCDDLAQFATAQLGSFLMTSLKPKFSLDEFIRTVSERIGFLPLEQFKFSQADSKEYIVNAHWALYVENYLEGFHIPFVHLGLNDTLDYGEYSTLLFQDFNLQIGYTRSEKDAFVFPQDHIDHGRHIGAYYFWLFPNLMLNFYPWGLSVNIVEPQSLRRTKVRFLTYIFDSSKRDQGAGADVDKVEREDEFVVENVQRGIISRHYPGGRYSPDREQGVHHFHSILGKYI